MLPRWYVMICQHWKVPSVRLPTNFGKSKVITSLPSLAKLLRGDIEEESAFLSSPVQIKEQQLYPIPNYGSAMSPFYGVLSLWVGSTLLISLLRAEAENPGGKFRGYELYLGRLATFLTIGLLQAICVSLGDILILGTYVADKLWFVLFAMLVSAVFVTITYTLLSVFGNIGKGIAIIFMVFQFSRLRRYVPNQHDITLFPSIESVHALHVCDQSAA